MEFKRKVYEDLLKDLNSRKIIILFGARQIGKTFLLEKLQKYNKNTKLFRLEEPDDLVLFNKSDSEILRLLRSSGDLVLLDEFHYIKNASHIFKAIYDSKSKPKIYATGSSAIEMHKHLKESLAGRFKAYYLKPVSLEEFKSRKDLDIDDYLVYGALPGVYDLKENPKNDDRKKYLRQILATYIQKDIKSLIKEENISAFNNLLYFLAENQGQIIPSSNLSREIGLSQLTVEKYLNVLEQTFVLYCIKSFSGNLSNELKKSKKYYFYDLGIRNALLKNFESVTKRKDKGKVWETFCYLYLLSIINPDDSDIYFWRTSNNAEVDFILVKNTISYPIEIKSKLSSNEIPDGIKTFIKAYTNSPFAIVLNETLDSETEFKGKKIYFISFKNIETIKALLNPN